MDRRRSLPLRVRVLVLLGTTSLATAMVGCKQTPTTKPEAAQASTASASPGASASSSADPSPSATASASIGASSASSATKPPQEPPSFHKANETFTLGTTGLEVTPTFPYTVTTHEYAWKMQGFNHNGDSLYLMKKLFPPSAPLGEVVPCKNKSDYVPKKQPDGSFIYTCTGRGTGDGTWFGRILPTTDPKLPSLICSGSSKEPTSLTHIEATCRSIKLKK